MKRIAWWMILAVIMTACSPQASSPEPTLKPQQAADATPNADQSLAAAVSTLMAMNTRPNRMEVTTQPAEGKEQKSVIDFLPPDRKHIVSEEGEYIIVADKVYMKGAGMTDWQQPDIPAAAFIPQQPPTAEDIGKMVSDAHFIRAETLNGDPALLYGFAMTEAVGGLTLHSQVQLWLSADSALPLKMVKDGEVYGVSTSADGKTTSTATQAQTTILFDFASTLKIEAPVQ